MDANTPATPSFPGGNPVAKKPIQDDETMVIPAGVNPTSVNPVSGAVTSPARPKGPNASAVVLGLVAMVLAGVIIASETMDLQVDWSRLGPGGIVGIGLVLVVLGAIGLVRRHDDV
ncbi:MAG: hypothetical protein ABI899_11895 [Actinomycetota bacterium]